MTKRFTLIIGAMVIVFSLTLLVGGAISVFDLAQLANLDGYVKSTLFWGGSLIMLVGLAGLLAGLVGVLGSVIVKSSGSEE